MSRVLVVEKGPTAQALSRSLADEGHDVVHHDSARKAMSARDIDLVILDLDLPEVGAEVVRDLRRRSSVPMIVVSEATTESIKVAALDAGADDYVTKPYGVRELLARVRVALRRAVPGETADRVQRFDGIEIDNVRRTVQKDGRLVHLTPTEYSILHALASHPGRLLEHRWLLGRVWGVAYENESHYLREFVRSLRRKLDDDASAPTIIETERGVGYRWIAKERSAPETEEPSLVERHRDEPRVIPEQDAAASRPRT